MSHRNTKYLDNKRIVYRRDPITDKPTVEATYWDYYENGVGESKFGKQNLTHQGKTPDKGFHFALNHLEYPIRTYNGTGEGTIWLTCDIKGRYKGL